MKGIPGVDMSTGSLGQGFSVACGMAMASKLDNAPWRVYTITWRWRSSRRDSLGSCYECSSLQT